jgi:hypothetical protein
MREANCCIVQLSATQVSANHKERGSVHSHAGSDHAKRSIRGQETKNDDGDVEQDAFCIGDEQGAFLDQYSGGEELE